MDTVTTEKLLVLKLQRSEAIADKKIEMKNGCECELVDDRIRNIEEQINYIEFNGTEYVPTIEPSVIEVIENQNSVNPYVFKSANYFLEDFVETIECTGVGSFTISLTSVIGQKNREINIINSSSSTVNISASTDELIGNNGDSLQTRQLAVGDSVTLKSNGIKTWRIS